MGHRSEPDRAPDRVDRARGRCTRGTPGRRSAGTDSGTDRRARRRIGPRARDGPCGSRSPGIVARRDAGPAHRLPGGNGRGRLPRRGTERHRVGGPGGRPDLHGSAQAGYWRPEGAAPRHRPVVQYEHAADPGRVDGGPPRHAPQPGAGPCPGAGQRQAPAPFVGSRMARRQRRRLRFAGPRHIGDPRHRAAAGRGAAGRRRRAVRLRRHRRRDELPAQGGPLGRVRRAQHGDVRRRRRRIGPVRRQCRPADRSGRVRQPEPGVRQREPHRPGGAPAGRDCSRRGRQHARPLRASAGLGRSGHRRRPDAVRQLRLRAARRRAALRPNELRPQEGDPGLLLPEPEHPAGCVQQRRRTYAAHRRCARRQRQGLGRLSDGGRHQPRAGPGGAAEGVRRPELLLVPGDVPGRLHAADGRHGARRVSCGRRAGLHRRRLRLGPERLGRPARQRSVHPRYRQRLAGPGLAHRFRRRRESAAGAQSPLRRFVRRHGPDQPGRRRRVAGRAVPDA